MFTTRPFDAGFGYLTGGDLGDYAWPPKPKEELPAESRAERLQREKIEQLLAARVLPRNSSVADEGDEVVVGLNHMGFKRAVVLSVDGGTHRAVRVHPTFDSNCAACVRGQRHIPEFDHTCLWAQARGHGFFTLETDWRYTLRYDDEALSDEEDVDEDRLRLWSPDEAHARPRPVYLGQPTDDDHADDADFNTGQSARSRRYEARTGEVEDDEDEEAGVFSGEAYQHEVTWTPTRRNCELTAINLDPADPELVPRSLADAKLYLDRALDEPLYVLLFRPQYKDNTGTPDYSVLHSLERATNVNLRKGTFKLLQRHLRSYNLDWYKKHFPSDESCDMDWLDHTWKRVYVHDRLDGYKITLRGRLPGETQLNLYLTNLELIAEHGLW